MNGNLLYWPRVLEELGASERNGWAIQRARVGVPVMGDPCPPAVRIPLRALALQAFTRGNREAPLADALAEVLGWRENAPADLEAPRADVVIPVRGAHEALRLALNCLAHAQKNADPPLGVIVPHPVAELGPVGKALNAERPLNWRPTTIATGGPRTFAENCNLGAAASSAEFLILLNSDAYVGPGFIDAILAPFADPEVVAVGPMGTNVSGHQNVEVPFVDMSPALVSDVARQFVAQAAGGAAPYAARRLVGFCLAIRRSAWDRVGGLDERFTNAYDDDDLSLRLSLVGRCVVLPDLLVLHGGSESFRELPDAATTYQRTLVENRDRFAAKWSWFLATWNAWCDAEGVR